jgi:hypothetical protein
MNLLFGTACHKNRLKSSTYTQVYPTPRRRRYVLEKSCITSQKYKNPV